MQIIVEDTEGGYNALAGADPTTGSLICKSAVAILAHDREHKGY